MPGGLTIDHLIPSDRNWLVGVRKGLLDTKNQSVYEVNPENGEPVRRYLIESKDSRQEDLSCEIQGTFTGIVHRGGRITIVRGVAESPAQEPANEPPRATSH
jgi:hypothetical protein